MDNISTCVRCGEKYKDLNSFYKSLESKYSYHACMDVVDMVSIIVPVYISKPFTARNAGGGVLCPRGRGSLSGGGPYPEGGLCQGDLPCRVNSGQYASYWNAFLFKIIFSWTNFILQATNDFWLKYEIHNAWLCKYDCIHYKIGLKAKNT